MAVYNNSNAVVLGISIDSPFVLAKFKEEQNLQFQLLSDFNKEAITAYGVKYDVFPAFELQGVAKRAAFVVDKEGVIRYAEITATPGDLPNFTAIHEVLAQLG
jgi:peroxiredoxin